MNLLEVKDLAVQFATQDGTVYAVNGLSFTLDKGQTLGIVGESGSGKSQTVLALMGLLARNGRATGQALYHGQNLLTLPAPDLNRIRGNRMAMIFQDPMTSLNPYLTVERQMTEVLQLHKGQDRATARTAAIRMLDAVRIPEAAKRVDMYPHEFSGGMRQRVMIAMALLCEPEVLIADEPTTALDVTVQAQMLLLLARPAAGLWHRHCADHPRSGRGGRPVRPGGGDVRRACDGAGQRAATVQVGHPPLYAGAAQSRAAHGPRRCVAAGHPWCATQYGAPAQRLPVQPALRLCRRKVPRTRWHRCKVCPV
jgi:ABC-type dipeptide/oligopeptide/nickel transport system ATPase subunit